MLSGTFQIPMGAGPMRIEVEQTSTADNLKLAEMLLAIAEKRKELAMSEVMRACLEYRRALREFDRQKLKAIAGEAE